MPELPEVETIRIGLSKLLPGKKITGVSYDTAKSFPNAPQDVERFLIGASIVLVKRRAKVLLIELDTEYSLVIHLKMTGQLVYIENQPIQARSPNTEALNGLGFRSSDLELAKSDEIRFGAGHPSDSLVESLPDKSTRVILELEGVTIFALEPGAKKLSKSESPQRKDSLWGKGMEQGVEGLRHARIGVSDTALGQERWQSFGLSSRVGCRVARLYFNDQRKFGWMRLIPTAEVSDTDFFKRVGPEPLATNFTAEDFLQRLTRRPDTSIKAALIDQSVIAGVGNIYADESLWGAKLHPATLVKQLSTKELDVLFKELRYVLELSIQKGGSTDRNYVNHEGKRGNYLSFAKVFRREGQLCPRCGTTIIKMRVATRGTHICPKCQMVKRLP